MNTPQPLPVYSDEALVAFAANQLLVRDEDRVPRNVIDECARRGDAIVQHLGLVLENHHWNAEASDGEWWRLLHAVMILGLIPTEAAGLLLVQYMRRMSEQDDDVLQDWLAGHWPAIFDNKPASLMSALRALSEDRDFDWYIRACATDAMVAMARRTDSATLNDALENLAAAARDETEDACLPPISCWIFRDRSTGNCSKPWKNDKSNSAQSSAKMTSKNPTQKQKTNRIGNSAAESHGYSTNLRPSLHGRNAGPAKTKKNGNGKKCGKKQARTSRMQSIPTCAPNPRSVATIPARAAAARNTRNAA